MNEKTLGIIIALTIAVILIFIMVVALGPQKLVGIVSKSLESYTVSNYVP